MISLTQISLSLLARFRKNERGGLAVVFGLTLIPILGLVGTAIDYGQALNARTLLQEAADTAALAAVTKFEPDESKRKKFAQDAFAGNVASSNMPISVTPIISINGDTATVTASATTPAYVLGIFKINEITVAVSSTAVQAAEEGPVCVLALDPAADEAIDVNGTADISAEGCVVHANSKSDTALSTNGSTTASAEAFCAVGGHSGNNFTPEPYKNCSVVSDPMANLTAPATAGCDYNNTKFNGGSHNLNEGVYCGGITVNAGADVTLAAGVYVIKDGALTVRANSSLSGSGVVFYLTGDDAVLKIRSQSNVDLTAPTNGAYAGMVFVQDPNSSVDETSTIEGGGTLRIVGMTYLPTQALDVGGGGTIGLDSPYMPLIAKTVKFHGNAQITIKVDAAAAGMPEVLPSVRIGSPRLIN